MYLPLNLSITSFDTPQLFNRRDTSSISFITILTIYVFYFYAENRTHRKSYTIWSRNIGRTQNALKQLWIKCSGLRAKNI